MKLPKLPELPSLDILDEIENNQGKGETLNKNANEKIENRRPRIPKSQYDAEGKPLLMIPDINDVALNTEINKYFGKYKEED